MTYILTALYLIGVYIRPGEIIPGWIGFPFMGILSGVTAVALLVSLLVRPRRFWSEPQDRYVLGYFAATVISNPAWGWFYGGYLAFLKMAPVVFCYFLIRAAVVSSRQLRGIGYLLVGLTVFQACIGIAQFNTGVGLGNMTAIEEPPDADPPGGPPRIRGTGIFGDPNDLALALVAVVPFLLGPLVARRTRILARILALGLFIPIVSALFYTNSRGGILGFGVALFLTLYSRFGRVFGTVIAVVGIAALVAVGPSRIGRIDAQEESAQGRIQSWSEGLTMFKSHPLVGVGFGRYTDFNLLVAHNSFVHTLGELGLLGAFCFVGMGYWFFRSVGRSARPDQVGPEDARLCAWGEDLWRSGVALAVCGLFLSQQYSVLLFVWIALSGSFSQLHGHGEPAPAPRRLRHGGRIVAATAGAIVCVYVIVRIFGVSAG